MIKTNVLIIFKTRNTFFYYGTAAAALRMHLYVHGNPLRPLNILRFTAIVVPLRKTAPAIHTPSRGTYFPGTALPRAMKGRERSGDRNGDWNGDGDGDGDGHKKRQGTASGPLSFFRRRR